MKLSENSFRDVNIAFANELSLVCDHIGVNVRELIYLANHHPRVNVLQPGCGVGGHCIAVDPWFIAAAAPHCTRLIQAARHVNDGKSRWVIEQVQARALALEDQLGRTARIGCLGLAFKPDVDDLRESPALHITTELLVAGLDVLACEPNLHDHPAIKLHTLEEVLADADLLVFLVANGSMTGAHIEAGMAKFCETLEVREKKNEERCSFSKIIICMWHVFRNMMCNVSFLITNRISLWMHPKPEIGSRISSQNSQWPVPSH